MDLLPIHFTAIDSGTEIPSFSAPLRFSITSIYQIEKAIPFPVTFISHKKFRGVETRHLVFEGFLNSKGQPQLARLHGALFSRESYSTYSPEERAIFHTRWDALILEEPYLTMGLIELGEVALAIPHLQCLLRQNLDDLAKIGKDLSADKIDATARTSLLNRQTYLQSQNALLHFYLGECNLNNSYFGEATKELEIAMSATKDMRIAHGLETVKCRALDNECYSIAMTHKVDLLTHNKKFQEAYDLSVCANDSLKKIPIKESKNPIKLQFYIHRIASFRAKCLFELGRHDDVMRIIDPIINAFTLMPIDGVYAKSEKIKKTNTGRLLIIRAKSRMAMSQKPEDAVAKSREDFQEGIKLYQEAGVSFNVLAKACEDQAAFEDSH